MQVRFVLDRTVSEAQFDCIVEGGDSLPSSCHPTTSAKCRPPLKKNVAIGKVLNPRYHILHKELLQCMFTCEFRLTVFLNAQNNGSLYFSVTPKFYTEVLHQTLNPTAELWCKTLSRIKVDLVLHRT